MELKDIIKPAPARNYTAAELGQAFRIALHNKGIREEDALRQAIFKKVREWNPKEPEHNRVIRCINIRRDLARQGLNWKVFCKAAAILELDPLEMVQVIA